MGQAENAEPQRYRIEINVVLISNLLWIMLGIFLGCKEKPENNSSHFTNSLKTGSVLELEVTEELRPSDFYWKYTGMVKKVDQLIASGKILIRI